jgi:hypothetical protein
MSTALDPQHVFASKEIGYNGKTITSKRFQHASTTTAQQQGNDNTKHENPLLKSVFWVSLCRTFGVSLLKHQKE